MLAGCLVLLSFQARITWASTSVLDFGAKGDSKSDDTAAFARALAKCGGELIVPEGVYRIANLQIPAGTLVRGVGVRSVITMPAKANAAVLPGDDCTLTDLRFEGAQDDKQEAVGHGIILLRHVHGVRINRVSMERSSRAGILTDHADDFSITDSRFNKVAVGISIVFSHNGLVSGNVVQDAKGHGIQFWGNWEFKTKDASDLVFIGNIIKNVGGGGIWGTGAVRVVMSGNTVDGAGDIALDYEWCDDSTIVGNTVRNGVNAGISLFYGCMNITISANNVVVINGKQGERHGIWLTDPDRAKFAADPGHRTIGITGNTVRIETEGDGPKRHAIYIGANSSDITLSANTLVNGDILDRSRLRQ